MEKYFLGVDWYDRDRFSMCVMKKVGKVITVVCMYNGRTTDPKVLDAEIKKVAEQYNIPESAILKETN